jgi:hypothetical protein
MMYTNGRIPFICEQGRNLGLRGVVRKERRDAGKLKKFIRVLRGSVKDTILVLRIRII